MGLIKVHTIISIDAEKGFDKIQLTLMMKIPREQDKGEHTPTPRIHIPQSRTKANVPQHNKNYM